MGDPEPMEKLYDKTRITVLLQKLLERRALLSIQLDNHPLPFSSAVIEVNRDGDFFVIDELKPETGDELLRQNPTVHIIGHLDGVVMRLASTVREFGMDNNILFYKLPIPEQADYHQRRQAVRVKLSAANPLAVTFTDKSGENYKGEIENLSIGGLRARFRRDLPYHLETGMKLSCSFLIPPDRTEKINSDFVIRAIKHEHDTYKSAFLGGQFLFLAVEKQMERKLQRAIMTLQRASRQKEAS